MTDRKKQPRFNEGTILYDMAREFLALKGIHTPEQAYAAFPNMLRTEVRKIFRLGKLPAGSEHLGPQNALREGEPVDTSPAAPEGDTLQDM